MEQFECVRAPNAIGYITRKSFDHFCLSWIGHIEGKVGAEQDVVGSDEIDQEA
jgi:hypothetical protein